MNWKSIFPVCPKKLRDSLRDRRALILTIVIPDIVMAVMVLGMRKIMPMFDPTACEEDLIVMVGLWPLYGVGLLHFMFIR